MKRRRPVLNFSYFVFLVYFIGSIQCSKNPQLPSTHYKPELVVFGILAPGQYKFKGETKNFYHLNPNFFMVQRTFQIGEKLVFRNFDSVSVFIDSLQLHPAGYAGQAVYDRDSFGEAIDSVRVYSFDQETFRIKAGQVYTLRVIVPGFHALRARTQVPGVPVIRTPADSVISVKNRLTIEWAPVGNAGGYRVLLYPGKSREDNPFSEFEDEVGPENHRYVIDGSQLEWLPREGFMTIEIQAIDQNYTRYLSLRNLFFSNCLTQQNFNVEGGYGVFGSLSLSRKTLYIRRD
ncbi:hypothetical protein BMS3Bbin03_01443 [bacterium BMS3Bbin03]|nr:hypothetical protein BMS3Bbin03_01443 [bacterium BMS3Bbin03]